MNLLESSFPAQLKFLRIILSQIKEYATPYITGATKLFRLELACEEALMNIISHAYPENLGNVDILCRKNDNTFEIIIRDYGLPFNPLNLKDELPKCPYPEQVREGGLGITLLLYAVDDIKYIRLDQKNVLTLSFHIEKCESSS